MPILKTRISPNFNSILSEPEAGSQTVLGSAVRSVGTLREAIKLHTETWHQLAWTRSWSPKENDKRSHRQRTAIGVRTSLNRRVGKVVRRRIQRFGLRLPISLTSLSSFEEKIGRRNEVCQTRLRKPSDEPLYSYRISRNSLSQGPRT